MSGTAPEYGGGQADGYWPRRPIVSSGDGGHIGDRFSSMG
jgi:hypothetical protein